MLNKVKSASGGKTKLFFLTALAVAALTTASFSTILAGNQDETTLKCFDDRINKCPEDTGDNGGIKIPPIGN